MMTPKRWACEVIEVSRDVVGGVTLAVGWRPDPRGGWLDADDAEAEIKRLRGFLATWGVCPDCGQTTRGENGQHVGRCPGPPPAKGAGDGKP